MSDETIKNGLVTEERRIIHLTVKVAVSIIIFIITITASSVTTWAVLTGKVRGNTESIAENKTEIQAVKEKSESTDQRLIELINGRIQVDHDILMLLKGLETDIKYIREMIDDLKE